MVAHKFSVDYFLESHVFFIFFQYSALIIFDLTLCHS